MLGHVYSYVICQIFCQNHILIHWPKFIVFNTNLQVLQIEGKQPSNFALMHKLTNICIKTKRSWSSWNFKTKKGPWTMIWSFCNKYTSCLLNSIINPNVHSNEGIISFMVLSNSFFFVPCSIPLTHIPKNLKH
jgi:hypothetical protein